MSITKSLHAPCPPWCDARSPRRPIHRVWSPPRFRFLACCLVACGVSVGGGSGLRCWAQESTPGAAVRKPEVPPVTWKPLFDGKSLAGWKVTNFGGQGEVQVEDGSLVLGMGSSLTGITSEKKDFPKCDYAIQLEARRLDGVDFFSTLTFPVQDSFCSLVVGGWAGAVVGISCIDHADASQNETTRYMKFNKGQWYRIRVEVRRDRIQAWIDDERVVDLDTAGHKLATRIEVRLAQPLGITSWETRAALRNIQYRLLTPEQERSGEVPAASAETPPTDKKAG
ncbi:MAG: 3-keto-disaccharide hydrolase [Pirellulaceae bacterium]